MLHYTASKMFNDFFLQLYYILQIKIKCFFPPRPFVRFSLVWLVYKQIKNFFFVKAQ